MWAMSSAEPLHLSSGEASKRKLTHSYGFWPRSLPEHHRSEYQTAFPWDRENAQKKTYTHQDRQ